MDVVHQEDSLSDVGKSFGHGTPIKRFAGFGNGPFKSVQDAILVSFGLQTTEEPGAGIGQPLVIQVTWFLGRQDNTEAECACLLESRKERFLGWRLCDVWHVSKNLIDIEQRS